jgi:hypothetical protein
MLIQNRLPLPLLNLDTEWAISEDRREGEREREREREREKERERKRERERERERASGHNKSPLICPTFS